MRVRVRVRASGSRHLVLGYGYYWVGLAGTVTSSVVVVIRCDPHGTRPG